MSFLIPAAQAQEGAATGADGGGNLSFILLMVGMCVLMYFMVFRPQHKRQKEHKSLMTSIDKGDEVITIGGMLGKVIRTEGEYLVLDVGSNVHLKFQKVSVQAVLPKGTIKGI
ncbi:preprotein translocase subunit YajC [bacterium]|nr:preprotein translocase subunit YajC [bacterium]